MAGKDWVYGVDLISEDDKVRVKLEELLKGSEMTDFTSDKFYKISNKKMGIKSKDKYHCMIRIPVNNRFIEQVYKNKIEVTKSNVQKILKEVGKCFVKSIKGKSK